MYINDSWNSKAGMAKNGALVEYFLRRVASEAIATALQMHRAEFVYGKGNTSLN